MGMTNYYRTWGDKTLLVDENRDNSTRRRTLSQARRRAKRLRGFGGHGGYESSGGGLDVMDLPLGPPCSPNPKPLGLFFFDYLKSLVYEAPVVTMEDLMERILIASTPDLFERVRQFFNRRCRLYYDLNRPNFGHFM
ncbi:hypothetical protein TNCV_1477601 [Trichonephila clavipes]|nr:hypothetical protein TNCV_1477601 [Trichonephila clavipes]